MHRKVRNSSFMAEARNSRLGRKTRAQLPFEFSTHGGARPGAGRKRRSPRVPHTRRARRSRVTRHTPIHVTLRVRREVAKLRRPKLWQALRRAFYAGCERAGFRICQFSVQRDHIHLLCGATSSRRLASGMNGFSSRLARLLNAPLGRSGRVFADRYHHRALKTPAEVRNALAYVLLNARHHGEKLDLGFDPYSSARYFDGWKRGADIPSPALDPPVAAPQSWLLRVGWRRRGLLDPAEIPGAARGSHRTSRFGRGGGHEG